MVSLMLYEFHLNQRKNKNLTGEIRQLFAKGLLCVHLPAARGARGLFSAGPQAWPPLCPFFPQYHPALPHDGLGPGRTALRGGSIHAVLPFCGQVSRGSQQAHSPDAWTPPPRPSCRRRPGADPERAGRPSSWICAAESTVAGTLS